LFAEIVRRTDLIEYLRTEYKVTVAGPSTISAFLNSLQMGFRTLAIEKRSSEVWNVLGAVKTEFGKFESKLEKVQGYFGNAQKGLEDLVGTRTRVMMSKLKKVEQLPDETAAELLGTEEYPEEGDSNYDIS
ncbi:MAG: DNA recombination protein RmuC, partial [Eubacteriales bacterium]